MRSESASHQELMGDPSAFLLRTTRKRPSTPDGSHPLPLRHFEVDNRTILDFCYCRLTYASDLYLKTQTFQLLLSFSDLLTHSLSTSPPKTTKQDDETSSVSNAQPTTPTTKGQRPQEDRLLRPPWRVAQSHLSPRSAQEGRSLPLKAGGEAYPWSPLLQ